MPRRDERALVGRHLKVANGANGLGCDLAELDVHPGKATERPMVKGDPTQHVESAV